MTSTNQNNPAKCPNCGNQVNATAEFCPFCGTQLAPTSSARPAPTPPTAAPTVPSAVPLATPPTAEALDASAATRRSQCEMIIGYLVPHRCDNPALGRCTNCGRGYCDEHVAVTSTGLLCLACQQGLAQPIALPLTAQTYDAADIATFHNASHWDNDDDTFSDLS